MDNTPWGCDSDYGVLRDVALRSPEYFGWFGANAVAKETLRKGITFDPKLAADQHAAFVAAFEDAGVRVHMVEPRVQQLSWSAPPPSSCPSQLTPGAQSPVSQHASHLV